MSAANVEKSTLHPLDAFKAELRGAPMATELPCKQCLLRTKHYALGRRHDWQSWVSFECSKCETIQDVGDGP